MRRFVVPAAASLWAHLSVLVLAGLSFPDLLEAPTDPGPEQAGAHTEVDGADADGEALEELVPVSLDVVDEAPVEVPVPVEAPAPPPPAPISPALPTKAEEVAQAGPEAKPGPVADRVRRAIARPSRPRGSVKQRRTNHPPCELPEEIALVADDTWSVERALVEFYAMNLDALMEQASVWTHKDAAGKADGFRVGLSRCSVGKAAGLRSGDIVHRINDRRITNIPQAIAAYFDLRNEERLAVHITRSGKPVTLYYYIEQPTRSELRQIRKATRKDIRAAAKG